MRKDSLVRFEADNAGLTSQQAEAALRRFGPNRLEHKKRTSAVGMFLNQFKNVMIIILGVSTAISCFMGEITEALAILIIIVVNAILGFAQEFKTEKTMEALEKMVSQTARVIRDDRVITVDITTVVPGDCCLLEPGDRVPADAAITECLDLMLDESLLTGESAPVEKEAGEKIFMGTSVVNGRGRIKVGETGMNTEMGRIAHMIQNIDVPETPLQKKLTRLGKFIAAACLVICAIVSLTGILRGEELITMLLAGISLAVAAVPEGLPAIVTISLAIGVRKMLRRKALVRKLPSVETLGCASVICSDKTGTLTENNMTMRKVFCDGRTFDAVQQSGRAGRVYSYMLEAAALCNNAVSADTRGGERALTGNPTDKALLAAAYRNGVKREVLDMMYERIEELPFDSTRKCMSVVCRDKNGEHVVFTKGAPDIVLAKCVSVLNAASVTPLHALNRRVIIQANDEMASGALRVIAVAYKPLDGPDHDRKDLENGLTFLGLAGIMDPPRKEAYDAVEKCRQAGIKTVMITGDHKNTALAVARELNIARDAGDALTGPELESMNDAELAEAAARVTVYARVSPGHKLRIVKALKSRGLITAMTGDGVNDAPAVKEADIGVSMGLTGTDVTKEASSMILLDDNFATIVSAVEEGRMIFDNIRKFIRYMLACNLGEVLTMFVGMLAGLPLPLVPIQILWVNLVTDGLPAIALGFDPADRDIMRRQPRGASESIFSHGLLGLITVRGVLIGLTTLAVFTLVYLQSRDLERARTAAFVTLVVTQLIHVFECKSETRGIFGINIFNNMLLVGAVIVSFALMLLVIYIPYLQVIFKTAPLNGSEWLMLTGLSFAAPVIAGILALFGGNHKTLAKRGGEV